MARLLTRDEAENLLPRIEPLLEEMRTLKQDHDSQQVKWARLQEQVRGNGHGLDVDLQRTQQKLQQCTLAINGIIDKVKALGAEVKDVDMGLIDFRSRLDGREVYLCWKLGEGHIAWWHDLNSGFAARQPLD